MLVVFKVVLFLFEFLGVFCLYDSYRKQNLTGEKKFFSVERKKQLKNMLFSENAYLCSQQKTNR